MKAGNFKTSYPAYFAWWSVFASVERIQITEIVQLVSNLFCIFLWHLRPFKNCDMTALFSAQALVGGKILNKCIPINALETPGSISTVTPTDTSNRDFSLSQLGL